MEGKKSGVKGVTWNAKNKKWIVKLSSEYLGSFDNLEDAIQKRKEAETQKTPVRFCVVCGKLIPSTRHANATTCSEECAREKERRYMRQKQAEYKALADKPAPKTVVKPPKKCETCGESIPGESKARFCPRCLRKRHSAQVMESGEKTKKGEILDPPRTCVICGSEIPRTRNRQAKTCSDACSQKLNKQRMRENYIKKHPVKRPPGRKPTGNNMQPLNVAVPQDVLKKIKTAAQEREITVSEYVRRLIQQGVEKEKKTNESI